MFSPADLGPLLRAELPGEVGWERIGAGYPAGARSPSAACTSGTASRSSPTSGRSGCATGTTAGWSPAAIDGTTVGAVTYRIDDHGGALIADDLLVTDPYARALLLQFFARHVDQVERIQRPGPRRRDCPSCG